jgi:hypothetical protein
VQHRCGARLLQAQQGHTNPSGARLQSAVHAAAAEVSEYKERLRSLRAETEQLQGLFEGLRGRATASALEPHVQSMRSAATGLGVGYEVELSAARELLSQQQRLANETHLAWSGWLERLQGAAERIEEHDRAQQRQRERQSTLSGLADGTMDMIGHVQNALGGRLGRGVGASTEPLEPRLSTNGSGGRGDRGRGRGRGGGLRCLGCFGGGGSERRAKADDDHAAAPAPSRGGDIQGGGGAPRSSPRYVSGELTSPAVVSALAEVGGELGSHPSYLSPSHRHLGTVAPLAHLEMSRA